MNAASRPDTQELEPVAGYRVYFHSKSLDINLPVSRLDLSEALTKPH